MKRLLMVVALAVVLRAIILAAFIVINVGAALAEDLSGEYVSLNGKFHHIFKPSGDYWGEANHGKKYKSSGSGLYQQGNGLCWTTRLDGSKGATGNLILYVDEGQCCLEVRHISDKIAVTKIWVKGYGTAYALCENQVWKKKK